MGIPPSSSAIQPPTDVLDLSRATRGVPFPPKSDEFKPLHIPPPMQVCFSVPFTNKKWLEIEISTFFTLQIGSSANPLPHAPPPPLGPTSSGTPMLDLSLKRDPSKQEVKASPFSAEALLSRPSPKPQVCANLC